MKKALAIIGIVLVSLAMIVGLSNLTFQYFILPDIAVESREFAWYVVGWLKIFASFGLSFGVILIGISTLIKEPKT